MPYRVVRAEVLVDADLELRGESLDDEGVDFDAALAETLNRFERAGWAIVGVLPRVPTVVEHGLATPFTCSIVFHKAQDEG